MVMLELMYRSSQQLPWSNERVRIVPGACGGLDNFALPLHTRSRASLD